MAQALAGILEKAKAVIRSPENFFVSVKSEKGIKPCFAYLAVVMIAYSVASYLLGFLSGQSIVAPFFVAAFSIFSLIAGILFSFLMAGFLHLFVLILGGKRGYVNTYKALYYPSAIYLLLLIPQLFFGFGFAGMLIGTVIAIPVVLWMAYATLKGISVLHEMSMVRAFAALMLPLIIGVAILMAVAFTAFLFYFGALV